MGGIRKNPEFLDSEQSVALATSIRAANNERKV
jgi:hypothetical protein